MSAQDRPQIPPYLLEIPDSAIQPPASTSRQVLPLAELSWQDFERLCLRIALHESDAEVVRQFGRPGQTQQGIDIYGRKRNGRYIVYQCRQRSSFTPGDIKSAISDFVQGEWAELADEFVICTSADGSSTNVLKELEEQTATLRRSLPGLSIRLHDRVALSLTLKRYPELVLDFFGKAWADLFLQGTAGRAPTKLALNDLPRAHDLGWSDLGVRRAGRACDETGWTPKLNRAIDSKLRALLRRAVKPPKPGSDSMCFILLVGEAGAGKSRAMFDAVNMVCPEAWLYRPSNAEPTALGEVLEDEELTRWPEAIDTPLLVWLDDLELFVPPDESGITAARISTLRKSARRIIVMATAGGKSADIARARHAGQSDDGGTVLSLVMAESTFWLKVGAKGVTKAAIDQCVESGDYNRGDVAAIKEHGVGPFVLGADLLSMKLHTGRYPPEAPPSVSGQAVARATLAWNACGVLGPIDRQRLRGLWPNYFQGEPSAEAFAEGLRWAQEPVIGDMALVEREDDQYRCNDLVVAAERESMTKDEYLSVLDIADPAEAAWISYWGGGFQPRVEALEQFVRDREPLGDDWWPFQVAMGRVWRSLRQPDRARESWEHGLDGGCYCAGVAIADMRADEGDTAGAVAALQHLLDLGVHQVAVRASLIYEDLGERAKALDALRKGADIGDGESAYALGYALQSSNPTESERAFRLALEHGSIQAWLPLWIYYMEQGDHRSAAEVATQASELGVGEASTALGVVLEEHLGDSQGAIAAYQQGCERDEPHSYVRLGSLYSRRGENGDANQAVETLTVGAAIGSGECAHILGHILESQGDIDGASDAFGEAITLGELQPVRCLYALNASRNLASARERALAAGKSKRNAAVIFWIATAIEATDGTEAANSAWQELLESRASEAVYMAGLHHRDIGNQQAAEDMLLEADDLGFPAAACKIGHIWADRGMDDLARDAGLRAQALGCDCVLGR